jgi:hypothetical protein
MSPDSPLQGAERTMAGESRLREPLSGDRRVAEP